MTSQSIAIWGRRKNPKAIPKGERAAVEEPPVGGVQVHFNLWLFRESNRLLGKRGLKHVALLDIGLWFEKEAFESLDQLKVYFPYKVSFEDLSQKFTAPTLASAIFNEPLVSSSKQGLVQLRTESDKEYQNVHILDNEEYEVNVDDVNSSLITFKPKFFERISKYNPKAYTRFRITWNGNHPHSKERSPRDAFFVSGFEALKLIDFKLNEIRNLPPAVSKKMSDDGNTRIAFDRIDFLLAIGAEAEVLDGHKDFHKCRLLEPDSWSEYVGGKQDVSDMVVYHWRELKKESGEAVLDFITFARVRFRRSNIKTIVAFSGVTLLLGALGGYIPTLIAKAIYYVPTFEQVSNLIKRMIGS